MAELVARAAIGVAFTAVYEGVKALIARKIISTSLLKSVRSRLNSLKPLIEEIEKCNSQLSYCSAEELKGLLRVMESGKELVERDLKIKSVSAIFKDYQYTTKLKSWNELLKEKLELLKVQNIRDGKRTAVVLQDIQGNVQDIQGHLKKTATAMEQMQVDVQKATLAEQAIEEHMKKMAFSAQAMEEQMKKMQDSVTNIENCNLKIYKRIPSLRFTGKKFDPLSWLESEYVTLPFAGKKLDNLPLIRATVGLETEVELLKNMIIEHDRVPIVVVTAVGGYGKTLIALTLSQDKEVRDTFRNNIIFISFPKKGNLQCIVQRLCKHKGIPFPESGEELPELQVVQFLAQFLKKVWTQPLLVIIDDIRRGFKSVLDWFDFIPGSGHRKILVTSRFEIPRFGIPFHLYGLSEDEAMALFCHSAGLAYFDKEDRNKSRMREGMTEFTTEARQIVSHCSGSPLAITVVGKSLCGKPAHVWRRKAFELDYHNT